MVRTRPSKAPRVNRKSAAEQLRVQRDEDPIAGNGGGAAVSRGRSEDNAVYTRKTVSKSKVPRSKRVQSEVESMEPERRMQAFDEFQKEFPPEWCERNLSFCCAVCQCNKKMKTDPNEDETARQDNRDYPFLFSDQTGDTWPHRLCCHKVFLLKDQEEFAPLYTAATNKLLDATEEGFDLQNSTEIRPEPTPLEWVPLDDIHTAYETAKTQESALYNADGEVHALDLLYTNEGYSAMIEKPFQKLCETVSETKGRRNAVVLEVFAGVGTGSVVLKRLGIAVQKVIMIEFDKIAAHVYKSNHDVNYNESLPKDHGGVEHVYDYERWEDFVNTDMEEFLRKHGPIDIVIGGPPCVDYSMVNARRQGTEGDQGKYMLQFGRTIRLLERLQRGMYNVELFFLAENVWLKGDDLSQVRDAFGFDWDPILLDAFYLSPTRRKRHFFTNIPLDDIDYSGKLSEVGPASCLQSGFCVPAHILDPETTVKAQCLMASKTRIDERSTLRMYVFEKEKNPTTGNYHGRPMKVCEREALMGYSKGYVEEPVRELFKVLVEKALSQERRSDGSWREKLDEKYHCFAGNYHRLPVPNFHRFEIVKELGDDGLLYDLRFQPELLMAPPVTNDEAQPCFFNAEEYAKHLIGNAFSVPVVEHLLKPLQKIFHTKHYSGYGYRYAWEDDMEQKEEAMQIKVKEEE